MTTPRKSKTGKDKKLILLRAKEMFLADNRNTKNTVALLLSKNT